MSSNFSRKIVSITLCIIIGIVGEFHRNVILPNEVDSFRSDVYMLLVMIYAISLANYAYNLFKD